LFDLQKEIAMWKNVGAIDRVLRVVIGAILLALVFIGPKTAWGWLGVIPLATGLIGFCPLYRLLGINTSHTPLRGARAQGA